MVKKDKNYDKEATSATCLLLSIAISDDKLENDEIHIIKEIICDFFNIESDECDEPRDAADQFSQFAQLNAESDAERDGAEPAQQHQRHEPNEPQCAQRHECDEWDEYGDEPDECDERLESAGTAGRAPSFLPLPRRSPNLSPCPMAMKIFPSKS